MSTEIHRPLPDSATSRVDQLVQSKQDKKGKGKAKGKGKGRAEERETDNRKAIESEAGDFPESSRGKSRKQVEGKGLDEIDSDVSYAKDNDDDAVAESELSSHVDSDSDTNTAGNEGKNEARKNSKKVAKEARRAKRGQDYYDKRDAADKRQAAATANEGFSNYMIKRADRPLPEKRPDQVEKQWRGLYSILKFQWMKGGREALSTPRVEIVKRANEKIEQYCDKILNVDVDFNTQANALYLTKLQKLEKELTGQSESEKMVRRKKLHTQCVEHTGQPSKEALLKKWKFPADELCAQIYAIEKTLKELDDTPSEEAYNKKIADYKRRIEASQSDSDECTALKNKKTQREKLLANRKRKTEKLLQTALIFLDNLEEKGIPPTQVLNDRATTVFQDFVSLSRENSQLFTALKKELERPTLEQLDAWDTAAQPIYDLVSSVDNQDMATQQSIAKVRDLVKGLEKIDKSIAEKSSAILGEEPTDSHALPLSVLKEIHERYSHGHYEQVQINITRLLEQLRHQEAAVGLVRAIEFGQPPSGSKPDSNITATPAVRVAKPAVRKAPADTFAESSSTAAARATTASAVGASSMTGTNLSEDMLRNIDIMSLELGEDVTEMFQYDEGMTEYGPLVATRVSITENAKLNRYFVNAGLDTPGMEYFKVLKGSELGPGGAEKLADQKVVEFDLRQRKKDIKGSHPILSIGPVVMLPRSDGYVRRGTKERRQDAYIKVVYKDKPTPDMLCRTQFAQLAGPKYAEKQFTTLEGTYKQRQIYFEACKVQKLHPQTKKPLTAADLRKTPWLFPEGERGDSKVSSSSEEEEDSDENDIMKGVKVDDGALPADMTDPFQKPRASFQGASHVSGEL